jgi:hypothetical protein
MARILLLLVGVLGMIFSGTVTAAEPAVELTPKTALRLISMRSNVLENTVEISFILDGSAKSGDGFEAKYVRRVASIQPVRLESSQRRRLVFHDFFWNEELGWFTWEKNDERVGEAVYIWSELKGEIKNR